MNEGNSSVLPECMSHLQEVDLTCHEIKLAELAFQVKIKLPTANNVYRVRQNLNNWVSQFINPSQISAEAYQLISYQVY